VQLSREQMQALMLADTVAIPPAFPELGRLSYHRNGAGIPGMPVTDASDILVVEQRMSPKLTISRTFLARGVAAIFIPKNPIVVDLQQGDWLLGREIEKIESLINGSDSCVLGIAYVHERANTLLQVQIGMTAAESAEYYPPLPDERSDSHYQFDPLSCTESNLQSRPRSCTGLQLHPRSCT